jgi:hypothetical protein
MFECAELQTNPRPVGNWGAVSQAIETFMDAARGDDWLGTCVGRVRASDTAGAVAEFWTALNRSVSRARVAAKFIEMPPTAPNPKRVGAWLQNSSSHLSVVFSPLRERGPPRP